MACPPQAPMGWDASKALGHCKYGAPVQKYGFIWTIPSKRNDNEIELMMHLKRNQTKTQITHSKQLLDISCYFSNFYFYIIIYFGFFETFCVCVYLCVCVLFLFHFFLCRGCLLLADVGLVRLNLVRCYCYAYPMVGSLAWRTGNQYYARDLGCAGLRLHIFRSYTSVLDGGSACRVLCVFFFYFTVPLLDHVLWAAMYKMFTIFFYAFWYVKVI